MPRMDGTGPMGLGAETGFGRGLCSGKATIQRSMRYGRGYGYGMGMCRAASDCTKESLLRRRAALENALTAVEERLAKM